MEEENQCDIPTELPTALDGLSSLEIVNNFVCFNNMNENCIQAVELIQNPFSTGACLSLVANCILIGFTSESLLFFYGSYT